MNDIVEWIVDPPKWARDIFNPADAIGDTIRNTKELFTKESPGKDISDVIFYGPRLIVNFARVLPSVFAAGTTVKALSGSISDVVVREAGKIIGSSVQQAAREGAKVLISGAKAGIDLGKTLLAKLGPQAKAVIQKAYSYLPGSRYITAQSLKTALSTVGGLVLGSGALAVGAAAARRAHTIPDARYPRWVTPPLGEKATSPSLLTEFRDFKRDPKQYVSNLFSDLKADLQNLVKRKSKSTEDKTNGKQNKG